MSQNDCYQLVTIHHICGHDSQKVINMAGSPGADKAEYESEPCNKCANEALEARKYTCKCCGETNAYDEPCSCAFEQCDGACKPIVGHPVTKACLNGTCGGNTTVYCDGEAFTF